MYRNPTKIPVRKLVLHSVGCPQPSAAVFARQWQTARYFAHAVLQADGTVYQALPWDYLCCHVGAANAYSIGVEMTEPDCIRYTGGATFVCSDRARAAEQVTGTYNTAVELFAQLCAQFGLDPRGDIISHAEASAMGIGTDHADPEHLWRQLGMGYTMDGFRTDVAKVMNENDEEEDDMVRYNTIEEVPGWARGTVKEMMDAGLISGTGGGNLDLSADMLRMLYIMWHMRDTRYGRIVGGKVMDVPAWALDSLQKLVDDGVLAGVGDGKLDLSLDMLRMLAIMCRQAEK
nr:MAG TPA: N-acetylmuramoyl-L-alanine amidase [Caudoviricetes sp.]